jgi:trans-aconitate methyltransferase
MNEWSRFEDAQTRSLLRGAIPQKEMLRVLDLGSGTGHGYQLLSELGIAFNYSGLRQASVEVPINSRAVWEL